MTIFFRLLDADDKGNALKEAIDCLPRRPTPESFAVNPKSFEQVPCSPFAYWADNRIRNLFRKFPAVEGNSRTIKQGLKTASDFRFVRLTWEIPPQSLIEASNLKEFDNRHDFSTLRQICIDSTFKNKKWVLLAKGGAYSQYYADIHLAIYWNKNGEVIKAYADPLYDNSGWSRIITSVDFYFLPGITWSRRSQIGMSVRVFPKACIFSDKSPVLFSDMDTLEILLGILNSEALRQLIALQMAFGSYEVGVVKRTPIPKTRRIECVELIGHTFRAWSLKRTLDTITQTSHAFFLPALLQVQGHTLSQRAQAWTDRVATTEQELADIQAKIDELAFELYEISPEDMGINNIVSQTEAVSDEGDDDNEDDTAEATDLPALAQALIEYTVGVAFGRFDLRLATGDQNYPPEPEPFDPLPACSPGMLVTENGLPPNTEAEMPEPYPIQIPFGGILVDDADHPLDLARRVQSVLAVIWGEQSTTIEQEALDSLNNPTLSGYLVKSTAFFAEHLKRYSKSRRQAPIYWPLQTPSCSYTVWIYYHRLNEQALYTCVNDFIEPKLITVTEDLNNLRNKTPRSSAEEKELAKLADLEAELKDFRDELLRIAKFWKPNLNDGVQITAAPLWKLFQHKQWQKKLKETWEKLEKGDYDWAHLAYSIWPERVLKKCHQDRSLAIAHDVENDFWEEAPVPVKRRGKNTGQTKTQWQPKKLTENQLQTLIQQKIAAQK